MHSWRIGDITVARIESVELDVPSPAPVADWMVPAFASAGGNVRIAFSALALVTPDATVIVDPWLADDHPRDCPDADTVVADLLAALAEVGVDAKDVDVVVNTHCDGIGWNTSPDPAGASRLTFPNAEYRYPVATLEALASGAELYGGEGLAELRDLTDIVGVTPPCEVVPGVVLVDAPGHDVGHLAVRIESGGDLAVYPGHLVLSPFQVDDPGSTLLGEPPELLAVATATRRTLLDELADWNGLLVTTLIGGEGGGRVARNGADGYQLIA